MSTRVGTKRVLWLIQHKTLMQAEVPILRRLGYEVFVPKVFTPAPHHRSSGVSYEFDDSLTIPADVLEALNATDFYTEGLNPTIVGYLNEYFDAAFFIVLEALHINLLRSFRGPLVMRAFGVIEPQTYLQALALWGRGGAELIDAARDRFWFAACYPGLETVEPPLLAERATYLPIAMPDSFASRHAGTWVGDVPQILLICPDIGIDASANRIYQHFRGVYGDLPHVIVGKQTLPVDDPHVVGFVSDEELIELMRRSAVLLYPSREPRMMQYPPVEAAVMGLPVVFSRDSLLGGLAGDAAPGAVDDDRTGRALVSALLTGDRTVIDAVLSGQRTIVERFSESWCQGVWAAHLEDSGVLAAIEAPRAAPDLRGLDVSSVDRFVRAERLVVPDEPIDRTSIDQGVHLSHVNLSTAVTGTHGLGEPEAWGRWVHGDRAVFRLARALSGEVEVEVVGGATEVNQGKPIVVRLGAAEGTIRFRGWIDRLAASRVVLRIDAPADVLTITAPEVFVADGDRRLSIGISRLRVRHRPSMASRAVRAALELGGRAARRAARATGAGPFLRKVRSSLRRPRS